MLYIISVHCLNTHFNRICIIELTFLYFYFIQLNDKEEALAHQRKVSYMLARTLEEKENSLQQNKENNCSELASKNSQCKTDLESQESDSLARSCCQTYTAQVGSCSTSRMHTGQETTGTTESSCFPTSVTVHCTENNERKETDTN